MGTTVTATTVTATTVTATTLTATTMSTTTTACPQGQMGCVFATLIVGGVPDLLDKSEIENLGPVIGALIEMALPVSVWSMAVVATDITPTTTGSPTPAPTPGPAS